MDKQSGSRGHAPGRRAAGRVLWACVLGGMVLLAGSLTASLIVRAPLVLGGGAGTPAGSPSGPQDPGVPGFIGAGGEHTADGSPFRTVESAVTLSSGGQSEITIPESNIFSAFAGGTAPWTLSSVADGDGGTPTLASEQVTFALDPGLPDGTLARFVASVQEAGGAQLSVPVHVTVTQEAVLEASKCYTTTCTTCAGTVIEVHGRGTDDVYLVADRGAQSWANRLIVHATDLTQQLNCIGDLEAEACAASGSFAMPANYTGPGNPQTVQPAAACPSACPAISNVAVCRDFNDGSSPAGYPRSASGFARAVQSCGAVVEVDCATVPFAITAIGGLSLPIGGASAPIGIEVAGVPDDAGSALTLSAVSSNVAVVANDGSGLVFDGSEVDERTLTVVAMGSPGQTASITVTASYEERVATQTFSVTTVEVEENFVPVSGTVVAGTADTITVDMPTQRVDSTADVVTISVGGGTVAGTADTTTVTVPSVTLPEE